MMDGAQLTWAGLALFGPAWKVELRAALDVGDREFRRWIAGSAPVADGVERAVFAMLETRREAIDRLLAARPVAPRD